MTVQAGSKTDEQTEATEPPAPTTEFNGDVEELRRNLITLLCNPKVPGHLLASEWQAIVHGYALDTVGHRQLDGEGPPR